MPSKKKPAYLLHKPTGQARVRIEGKDYYLGAFGSPKSREQYDDLISEWCVRNGDLRQYELTIDELVLLYLEHARQHYRKNGEPTSEIHCLKLVCRCLVSLFGTTRVRDFGPRAFKAVRQALVERHYVRKTINSLMGRVRRMFRWGVENEYVPVTVYQALCTVSGLQKDRSDAAEGDPVLPVAADTVAATLPHLSPIVAAMVRLQLLTGTRPNEVCQLRPCDITIPERGGVWVYRPASHKTEHHGRERRVFIGPEGQTVLTPFLNRPPTEHCFTPQESETLRQANRRATRRSPMTPSQRARKPKANAQRQPRNYFDVPSYRRAITRACEKAFGMPSELRRGDSTESADQKAVRLEKATAWRNSFCWSPNQLRHTGATRIREAFGLEGAQVVLGHSDAATTEIYAERDYALAAKIMERIG